MVLNYPHRVGAHQKERYAARVVAIRSQLDGGLLYHRHVAGGFMWTAIICHPVYFVRVHFIDIRSSNGGEGVPKGRGVSEGC